jgi:Transglutaminase-like superfamily
MHRKRHGARLAIGAAVIIAWLAGLGFLVRREYFRPPLERLAEAALRVNPGVVYYGVTQGDRRVGFASSSIDTTEASFTVTDYLVADIPVGGMARRTTARTSVILSRSLRLRSFDLNLDAEGAPVSVSGRVDGDSSLILAIRSGTERPDTQRVALTGPILLPTLVPLALALGEKPTVGKDYVLPVFDPASMAARDVTFAVRAESLFVVNDSSVFDSTTGRWRGARPDTIKAWQVMTVAGSEGRAGAPGATGFSGWIDEQGRILSTTTLGFGLERMPYEVAFNNWRLDSARAGPVDSTRDILETTAIGAGKAIASSRRGGAAALRVRLRNVDLRGFDLDGGRQRLTRDTLVVTREPRAAMIAAFSRPEYRNPEEGRQLDPANTRAEPLLQVADPRIARLAARLGKFNGYPSTGVRRIANWVHDSLQKRITFGVPSAVEVLQSRRGDCNEHAQLFVALARAAGIPSRVVAGLAYIDGKFYYHAWAEVRLAGWIAVDPTLGQFPADAGHIRFVIGGVGRQAELLRLMGSLQIDVLGTQ